MLPPPDRHEQASSAPPASRRDAGVSAWFAQPTRLAQPAWVYLFGSCLYAGSVRHFPGTCGSLVAALLIWGCERLYADAAGHGLPWWWTAVAALACFAVALPVAARAVQGWGEDPQWFVLDEVVGVFITATGLAALVPSDPALSTGAAFVAFRIFDMTKPPPIGMIDARVSGGLGVMLDDVVAAVFAWPVALAALWLMA